MEFPLDFVHYLYNYYIVCALFFHTHHVIHHVITPCDHDTYDMILSHTSSCVVSPKEKEKEKKYK